MDWLNLKSLDRDLPRSVERGMIGDFVVDDLQAMLEVAGNHWSFNAAFAEMTFQCEGEHLAIGEPALSMIGKGRERACSFGTRAVLLIYMFGEGTSLSFEHQPLLRRC